MAQPSQQQKRRLAGKVAIVTGAGRGIGREEATLLASQGAKVVVNDVGRHPGETAQDVAGRIREAGGEAEPNTDSVASFEGAARLVHTAVTKFGRLDILVNNAGVIAPGEVSGMSEEDWDKVLAVHLKGTFATIRHATPVMKHQRSGVIINTGSESGLGHPAMGNYSAAKEGIVGLTRTVAREMGRFGIRCNAIRPRAMTEGTSEYAERFNRWQPLADALRRYFLGARGHIGGEIKPTAVATMVAWLCSEAASNVNGRTFYVGGDEIGLWSEPEVICSLSREGGWTLDAMDDFARQRLVGDLKNEFLIPEFGPKEL
ncbi:MAG TPA: SDR family NAD(P)-dependent oxidoreductase [Candidatus Binataceae bacterium]|nr:SDR family NAD(P)-dependent oxidoreductase [Candidatus Binataceae bacterium]